MATATIPLGDFTSEQMRVVGELARADGDGTVRVTPDQDLVFRWVAIGDARELYRRLSAASLGLAEAATIADVTSCPGAESCRLAVTQSRGLGRVLEDYLRARPDLLAAADGARIKISGCPNGCGQHHVATIGFQGSVRRLGSRAVPQYFVMVGGGTTAEGASFARTAAKVPARRIAETLDRLIAFYQRERKDGESAPVFFQREGTLVLWHRAVPRRPESSCASPSSPASRSCSRSRRASGSRAGTLRRGPAVFHVTTSVSPSVRGTFWKAGMPSAVQRVAGLDCAGR